MTESQQTLQVHSAEAKKGSYILTAPLGSAIPLKSSLHSSMRGHHPQPRLDTAWTQPEARACTCGPSVHSRMSRYHEVLSHGTPLVLVAIPAFIHLGCKTARHATILQLYSTAKSQHQIPQQQSLSNGTTLESWPQPQGQCKMLL